MNLILPSTASVILNSLGWTIMHSIWQGLLLIVAFFLLLILSKKKNIRFKYYMSLTLLFIFLGAVVTTFLISFSNNTQLTHTNFSSINESAIVLPEYTDYVKNKPVNEVNIESSNYYINILIHLERLLYYLNKVSNVIAVLWIVCVFALLLNHILSFIKLNRLLKHSLNQTSNKWQKVVDHICIENSLSKKIKVLISPFINSPFVYGIIKPVILFPLKLITTLSEEEIKSLLIHEIAHIKRYDPVFNIFQVFMESLFFYQPAVWYISKKIRIQREIICDSLVGELHENKKTYIDALIKTEELRLNNQLLIAAKKNQNELLLRIKWLLSIKPTNYDQRKPFHFMLPIVALLLLSAFSFIAINNSNKSNLIQQENFSKIVTKYLPPTKSSIVVFDTNSKKYLYFNDSICHQKYSPMSTFKIVSSLFALESGVAKDINFTIPWDSLKYPGEPWMYKSKPQKFWFRDQNLQTALKYSVNWFYSELHQLLGKEKIQDFLSQCEYGNNHKLNRFGGFWFNGSLKISAVEQVEFLKALNSKSVNGFSDKSQEETKRIMLNHSSTNYKIYGKTGTGEIKNDNLICWYVGFVETQANTYVFAFNMLVKTYKDMPTDERIEVVKYIFKDLNILN